MRLAIVGSRGYPSTYGGFETLVRKLAPYLVREGHEVTVYCRPVGGSSLRTRRRVVDDVECVTTAGVDRKTMSTLSYGLTASLDVARRHHDAAIVLNPANGYFLPILRRAGVPSVVNVDGLEWKRDKWNALGKRVFHTAARQVARHATTIVVDSRAIGEVWAEEFGVASTFIPYGADIIDVQTTQHIGRLGLADEPYVLYVGRLVPENNVELFIDAATRLRERYRVVVVGTAGYGDPIEARVEQLAAHPNVTWLGHVHNQLLLTELWANAGAYFHGHSVGGTNPALLQALGAGAPTVAYDSPFNREVLDGAGVMVGRNVREVVAAIEQVMECESVAKKLRNDGQARVAKAYRWDDVCRAYLEAAMKAPAIRESRVISTSTPARPRVSS